MTLFWRYLRSLWQPRSLARVQVVLYTRLNCPLCDKAHEFLQRERTRLGFVLNEVDIDADEALREHYGNSVPVVAIDGKQRFRGGINPVLWQRLVRALARETPA